MISGICGFPSFPVRTFPPGLHLRYPSLCVRRSSHRISEPAPHRYHYPVSLLRAPIILCPGCMILVGGPVIVPRGVICPDALYRALPPNVCDPSLRFLLWEEIPWRLRVPDKGWGCAPVFPQLSRGTLDTYTTTNVIESKFATVRLRTGRTKGCGTPLSDPEHGLQTRP